MKIVIRALALGGIASLAAVSSHASAESETDGWYLAVDGTVSQMEDVDSQTIGLPAPILSIETISKMQTGYGAQLAIGRKVGRVRLEIQGGYTNNSSDRYIAIKPPTGEIPADGGSRNWRAMANAYLDFGDGDFQPYVGAGIGYADYKTRLFAPRAVFPTESPILIIDDHKGDLTYQLMAGGAYEIAPGIALTAQYRWMSAGDVHFRDRSNFEAVRKQEGHNFDIGLRFRL